MSDVLPCPWCGKVPDLNDTRTFRETEGPKWGALVCCCIGPEVRTGYRPVDEWRDAAITAWNDRVQADAPAPLPAGAAEQQNDKVHMSNVTDDPSNAPADPEAKDDGLPGMLALAQGVAEQRWPHTIDAVIWAREWMKQIAAHPFIPRDEGCMIGWFANAIMAGYDTAQARAAAPAERPSTAAPARDALVDDDDDDDESPAAPAGLSVDPEIMHGRLCIAGTRIPVSAIHNYHAAGYSHDRIMKDYPDLTREQIDAALAPEVRRWIAARLRALADYGGMSDELWARIVEAAAALAQRDVPREPTFTAGEVSTLTGYLTEKTLASMPPWEPTDAMREVARVWADAHDCNVSGLALANLWRAMYDAAPQEQSAQRDDDARDR